MGSQNGKLHVLIPGGMFPSDVIFSTNDKTQWTLVGTILYATSLAFSKLSILLFYLRLSPQTWFRICIWLLVASVIIYATVYNLISMFGCSPIAATWDLSLMPGASCMNQLTKYMALSILNIIIEVFTLVLPIPIIAGLQMPKRQKVSVCGIFATGGLYVINAPNKIVLLTAYAVFARSPSEERRSYSPSWCRLTIHGMRWNSFSGASQRSMPVFSVHVLLL